MAATIIPQNYFKIFHSQINPPHGEQARIRWTQPQEGPVTIKIFNLLGDKVITLVNNENYPAEQYHEVVWNGKTSRGVTAGSGIYLVLFESPGYTVRGKVAVIK
jgi:flagellar hook assembly protein FlgD